MRARVRPQEALALALLGDARDGVIPLRVVHERRESHPEHQAGVHDGEE